MEAICLVHLLIPKVNYVIFKNIFSELTSPQWRQLNKARCLQQIILQSPTPLFLIPPSSPYRWRLKSSHPLYLLQQVPACGWRDNKMAGKLFHVPASVKLALDGGHKIHKWTLWWLSHRELRAGSGWSSKMLIHPPPTKTGSQEPGCSIQITRVEWASPDSLGAAMEPGDAELRYILKGLSVIFCVCVEGGHRHTCFCEHLHLENRE